MRFFERAHDRMQKCHRCQEGVGHGRHVVPFLFESIDQGAAEYGLPTAHPTGNHCRSLSTVNGILQTLQSLLMSRGGVIECRVGDVFEWKVV